MPQPRVALVWHNLTHEPRRLLLATAGIGFAVLLVFVEIGFRNALFDSTTRLARDLNADLVIVSKARYALPIQQGFDRARLQQALAVPGVIAAYPLYVERDFALLRVPGSKLHVPGTKAHPIRVLAYELADPALVFADAPRPSARLRKPNSALVDRRTKPKFGLPLENDAALREARADLSGHRVRLVGRFELGTDFASDGSLLMSAESFAHYFPFRNGGDPLGAVDFGLVRIAADGDANNVRQQLAQRLPSDVLVLTKQQLVEREIAFWKASTPIGFIFTVGTVMGLIVGVIICYQVIYTDIDDHTSEFATLKAMGYRSSYFVRAVVLESLYLALFGFLPGLAASALLYRYLAEHTGLWMMLTPLRVLLVLLLTVVMCVISGCLAMRKLLRADPAELY